MEEERTIYSLYKLMQNSSNDCRCKTIDPIASPGIHTCCGIPHGMNNVQVHGPKSCVAQSYYLCKIVLDVHLHASASIIHEWINFALFDPGKKDFTESINAATQCCLSICQSLFSYQSWWSRSWTVYEHSSILRKNSKIHILQHIFILCHYIFPAN